MAKYEILIGGKDQQKAHRYNKGDILSIHPWIRKSTTEVDHYENQVINGLTKRVPIMKDLDEGVDWGLKEIKKGLVVIVESNKTIEEMRQYTGSIHEHKISFEKITTQQLSILSDEDQKNYQLYKDCHSRVDLVELRKTITDLNDAQMENETVIYQPCKKSSQLIAKFYGNNNNRLLEAKDVNTVSVVAAKEAEINININSINLIKSNME